MLSRRKAVSLGLVGSRRAGCSCRWGGEHFAGETDSARSMRAFLAWHSARFTHGLEIQQHTPVFAQLLSSALHRCLFVTCDKGPAAQHRVKRNGTSNKWRVASNSRQLCGHLQTRLHMFDVARHVAYIVHCCAGPQQSIKRPSLLGPAREPVTLHTSKRASPHTPCYLARYPKNQPS